MFDNLRLEKEIKGRRLIQYNNEIPKNNKLVRKYTKSTN